MDRLLTPYALVSLLLAITMLTGLVMAVIMARVLRPAPHLRLWALACLLIAAGFALIAERGQIPDLLSILIANVMFIAGYAALLAGFSRLAGRPEGTAWGLGIAFCGFFTAAYLAGAEIEPRIVLVSLAVALFSVLAADRVFGAAEQVAPFAARLLGGLLVLNALLALGRLVVATGMPHLPTELRALLMGPIYMAASIFVTTAANGAVVLMTSETLQLRLRDKLCELEQSRALLAESLAERRNAAEMLSHDINSGLNRIAGTVTVLSERGLGPPEDLAVIRQTVRRMSQLIEDILGAANVDDVIATPSLVPLSAREVAADLCREHQITCTPCPEGPDVFPGDAVLVHIALANLVENAVKYGGDADKVTLSVSLRADEVAFCVTDPGPGISATDQRRVFEKYYRGTAAHSPRGSGLGLYFCRRIVDRHGGSITLDTNPSRVTLHFPRTMVGTHVSNG